MRISRKHGGRGLLSCRSGTLPGSRGNVRRFRHRQAMASPRGPVRGAGRGTRGRGSWPDADPAHADAATDSSSSSSRASLSASRQRAGFRIAKDLVPAGLGPRSVPRIQPSQQTSSGSLPVHPPRALIVAKRGIPHRPFRRADLRSDPPGRTAHGQASPALTIASAALFALRRTLDARAGRARARAGSRSAHLRMPGLRAHRRREDQVSIDRKSAARREDRYFLHASFICRVKSAERRLRLRGVLGLVGARIAAAKHLAHLAERGDVPAIGGAFGRRCGVRSGIQGRARLAEVLVGLDQVIPAGRRCGCRKSRGEQARERSTRHLHTEFDFRLYVLRRSVA